MHSIAPDNNATLTTCPPSPGIKPPSNCNIPPKIVMPEMALVMAINGECNACVTPATALEPTQTDKANVDNIGALGMLAPKAAAVTAPMV